MSKWPHRSRYRSGSSLAALGKIVCMYVIDELCGTPQGVDGASPPENGGVANEPIEIPYRCAPARASPASPVASGASS